MLGLSGPNGKHFCNHCLVTLSDVQKGKPHGAHILPKYQDATGDSEVVPVPISDDFELRTFARCKEQNAAYTDELELGRKPEVKNYENCEHKPLIDGNNIIDKVSTTPLHISLGIGLQALNILEEEAVQLDHNIFEARSQYDAFTPLYESQKAILQKYQELEDDIIRLQGQIREAQDAMVNIRRDRRDFFEKNRNGSYKKQSDLAKGVRARVTDYEKEVSALSKRKADVLKKQQASEKQLEKIRKDLDKVKGPFKTRFDEVLQSLHLKRAAYHSGSIVGPDVKKLTVKKNIKKFGNIFRPLQLKSENGDTVTYKQHKLRVKMITLLTKFSQCYNLYSANRMLCKHEVELLALRCVSFGNWFPVNFPQQKLKRKFHLLSVDVPKQARRMYTIGLLAEQTIESIHPYVNKLERFFCTVQNKQDKGLLVMKQQHVYSNPSLPIIK